MAQEVSGALPEIRWRHGDDLCNCTFQRIGFWTNPYIARTLEVRLCCMWKKLDEMYPGLMREIPAFTDYNDGDRYVQEPMLWNGEGDMPRALFHRQLAVLRGEPLERIRERFADMPVPKGTPRPKPKEQPMQQERTVNAYEIIGKQQMEIETLKAQMESYMSIFMHVLRSLKEGTLTLDQVTLTGEGFMKDLPLAINHTNGSANGIPH